ncbi:MAG: hypothetical protein ABJ360_16770 [Roseobacter sp.]|uniref:hypothetical protein n=1 Tax=Tateyamaria sp. TaxID=1929288 RepID=UPI00326F6F98
MTKKSGTIVNITDGKKNKDDTLDDLDKTFQPHQQTAGVYFAETFKDEFRFEHIEGVWRCWNGCAWVEDATQRGGFDDVRCKTYQCVKQYMSVRCHWLSPVFW